MDMEIVLGEGQRVDARLGNIEVVTNQDGSAPAPLTLFLASIGTCAGFYVLSFCQKRGIPTENIRIVQRMNRNAQTHLFDYIEIDIQLPPDFPEQYREAVVKSADLCAVKRNMLEPPVFDVHASIVEPVS